MIRLEKFDYNDYELLISWVDSAETLMQFAGPAFSFPLTREQLDESFGNKNRMAFKVVDAGNVTIGHAEVYVTSQSTYLGRIVIGAPQLRGKGIGLQIVSLLLTYCFEVLQQTDVALNVFDWNTSAIKCYEKAGFQINPDKKAERKVNGQTWIALNMTISKQTWMLLQ
ncbi:GNAT family N-acetyltransferase [Flavisolibacter tropicus]|uniref:N-acetyltransferase domain-containing protein n=1 Tax=Flavisolibacter tropicus TaxID=1492898 RepID=A0A172TWG3_9BACT|nr:GNAT family protein [Flavisolibacter tropicus]ANE51451.1 hypothetical protein SY85_13995 [Flavisolibacter tropicus]